MWNDESVLITVLEEIIHVFQIAVTGFKNMFFFHFNCKYRWTILVCFCFLCFKDIPFSLLHGFLQIEIYQWLKKTAVYIVHFM